MHRTANDPCCQPLTRHDPCRLQSIRRSLKARSVQQNSERSFVALFAKYANDFLKLAVCNRTANDPCRQPLRRQDPCSLQRSRTIRKVRRTANDPYRQLGKDTILAESINWVAILAGVPETPLKGTILAVIYRKDSKVSEQ